MVRELGITQATAHAILKTLTDRGWVTRDPSTKAFTLGPALAAVAAGLPAARSQVGAATAVARQMYVEFGHPASVVERVDDTLLITAFEGRSSTPGDRIPYCPPFGVAFAAWDSDEGQRAWIERGTGSRHSSAASVKHPIARLCFCRRAAAGGQGQHFDHGDPARQRQDQHVAAANRCPGPVDPPSVQADVTLCDQRLRQWAGFDQPQEPQQLVDPHRVSPPWSFDQFGQRGERARADGGVADGVEADEHPGLVGQHAGDDAKLALLGRLEAWGRDIGDSLR